MAEPLPVASLAQARERAVEALTAHFASDDLTVDQLEERLEMAYRATNAMELDALTADLRAAATLPPEVVLAARRRAAGESGTPDYDRVVAVMSSTQRSGVWLVPDHLDCSALAADATLDLTHAVLPTSAVIDIRVRALFASVKIILPPGLRVVNRMNAYMASVQTSDEMDATPMIPGSPVIRLSGWATMADVRTVVRHVEDASTDQP